MVARTSHLKTMTPDIHLQNAKIELLEAVAMRLLEPPPSPQQCVDGRSPIFDVPFRSLARSRSPSPNGPVALVGLMEMSPQKQRRTSGLARYPHSAGTQGAASTGVLRSVPFATAAVATRGCKRSGRQDWRPEPQV